MSVLKTEKPTAIQSIAAHEFLRQRSFDLVTLQRGQPLETAGVAAENAFFLVSGVCCHVLPFANRNVVTAVVGKGEMTGCSIVLGSPVSSSTVVVKMESRAFKVSRAELLAFCQESETFAASLLALCHDRISDLEKALSFSVASPIVMRLANLIFQFAERTRGEVLPFTHDEWAEMVGTRRPSVTDAIIALESFRVIKSGRGVIDIVDLHGLGQIVAAGIKKSAEGYHSASLRSPLRRRVGNG